MKHVAVMAAAVWLAEMAAYGQTGAAGITVTARGSATARPTLAEMTLSVQGSAEMPADALRAYTEAKAKGLAAVKGLGIETLTIAEEGFSLRRQPVAAGPRAVAGPRPGPVASLQFLVAEQLVVRLGGIDTLSDDLLITTLTRIMDAAREGGLALSAPRLLAAAADPSAGDGTIRFVVPDRAAVEKRACAAALADARRRAGEIAEAAGLKLGRVAEVAERRGDEGNALLALQAAMAPQSHAGGAGASDGLVSSTRNGVTLDVELQVRFAVAE